MRRNRIPKPDLDLLNDFKSFVDHQIQALPNYKFDSIKKMVVIDPESQPYKPYIRVICNDITEAKGDLAFYLGCGSVNESVTMVHGKGAQNNPTEQRNILIIKTSDFGDYEKNWNAKRNFTKPNSFYESNIPGSHSIHPPERNAPRPGLEEGVPERRRGGTGNRVQFSDNPAKTSQSDSNLTLDQGAQKKGSGKRERRKKRNKKDREKSSSTTSPSSESRSTQSHPIDKDPKISNVTANQIDIPELLKSFVLEQNTRLLKEAAGSDKQMHFEALNKILQHAKVDETNINNYLILVRYFAAEQRGIIFKSNEAKSLTKFNEIFGAATAKINITLNTSETAPSVPLEINQDNNSTLDQKVHNKLHTYLVEQSKRLGTETSEKSSLVTALSNILPSLNWRESSGNERRNPILESFAFLVQTVAKIHRGRGLFGFFPSFVAPHSELDFIDLGERPKSKT